MARRVKRLIAVAIPLAATMLALTLISLFSSAYLSVSELAKFNSPTRVSVMGNVTAGSVRYEPDHMRFKITDGVTTVDVIYGGSVLLDNSTGYARVVVKGIYYPGEGVIRASEVLVSCPSKEQVSIPE